MVYRVYSVYIAKRALQTGGHMLPHIPCEESIIPIEESIYTKSFVMLQSQKLPGVHKIK